MDSIKSSFRWALPIIVIAIAVTVARTVGFFGITYGPVMAVGVSDDGRYVISSHRSNHLVLWDLQNEHHQTLSNDANIYSAYFIPGHDLFLWQDLSNTVYLQNLEGGIEREFKHFPTYGHAMNASLTNYLSANENWNLFYGYGDSLKPLLRDSRSPSLMGSGKLLNLSLSSDQFFITAGKGLSEVDERPISDETPVVRPVNDLRFSSNFAGVVLWNYDTLSPVTKFSGNSVKTHAVISPDGQWVVSADENGKSFTWNTSHPERRMRNAGYSGLFIEGLPDDLPSSEYYDKSGLIDLPKGPHTFTIAVAFIHNSEYYLRFGNNSHFAALFKTGSPWPVKYFDLGESPKLVTYGSQYDRNTAIATSPEAGILAMGHQSTGGISVYQFDPDELTLERIWVVK